MEREIICVVCPSSCRVSVQGEGKEVTKVMGYGCKRGMEYATNEFIAPVRTLTTTMKAENYVSPIIAVRSSKPIPKEKQIECMKIIRNEVARAPFKMGRIVIKNIFDTDVDIVLTNC